MQTEICKGFKKNPINFILPRAYMQIHVIASYREAQENKVNYYKKKRVFFLNHN